MLAYIGISLAVIGAIVGIFATGLPWNSFVKWIGFLTVTVIFAWIFYTNVESNLSRSRYFGRVNIALLAGHCMMWLVILSVVPRWKFIWFMPILLEMAILLPSRRALLEWLNQDRSNPHSKNRNRH
jgi:hypothetical protein